MNAVHLQHIFSLVIFLVNLCVPGEIPGNAFGFNQHGLTITVNGLYPKTVLPKRTREFYQQHLLNDSHPCQYQALSWLSARNFVSRSLLSATTINDAIKIIQNKGVGGAYAFWWVAHTSYFSLDFS